MLLVTHFDRNYFGWFELMAQSLEITNPGINLYVYGTNLSDDQIQRAKSIKVRNVHVVNKSVLFDGPQERRDGSGPDAIWKVMMQCQVAEAALSAQVENPYGDSTHVITNADMLFVRPINTLQHYFDRSGADCLLHFTRDHIRRAQIQNGFIIINVSENSKKFLDSYDKDIKRDVHHFADQKSLLRVFNEYKNTLKFSQLPSQFIDGTFSNDAFVLSAHSGDRSMNMKRFSQILNNAKNQ